MIPFFPDRMTFNGTHIVFSVTVILCFATSTSPASILPLAAPEIKSGPGPDDRTEPSRGSSSLPW